MKNAVFYFFRVSPSQYNHEMLGPGKLSKNMQNEVKLQYYITRFCFQFCIEKISLS